MVSPIQQSKPKHDPVKAAIYNPKEFRGSGRAGAWSASSSEQPPVLPRRWPLFILLVALMAGAWHLWKGYSPVPVAPLPFTGEVQRFRQEAPNTIYGPFRVVATKAAAHYLVKLEDWQTGVPVMTVFVRRGEEANVNVPLGIYRYKYAYGTNWYGPKNLFGHETTKVQAVMPLAFTQGKNQVLGKIIDFAPPVTGNLKYYRDKAYK